MLLWLILAFMVAVYLFMRSPQFGGRASGERLARMQRSPHYRDGQFHNLTHTPPLTEGVSYTGVLFQFLFRKQALRNPPAQLPAIKTNLKGLSKEEHVLIWFGHSSYFLQLGGRTFLVDPVFSGSASPLRFNIRSFRGSDVYTTEDLPSIDYLLITHDHWDHLDHRTIRDIRPKVGRVITGLGVGAHLERWGYDPGKIQERDWNEFIEPEEGIRIDMVTARHFSGRSFKRNNTLWTSFVLTTPRHRIFIGGDSGYDRHFKEAGERFGPFDLAILENGQYDANWKYIHMMPEETVKAAEDLGALVLLPVHWSKFSLANHSWTDPITRVMAEGQERNIQIAHPQIGEKLLLDTGMAFRRWWNDI